MYYRTDIKLATAVAAFASVGAALIHFAAAPDHWREWLLSGLFFAALGIFQVGWAVVALRSMHRAVLGIGIAANIAAIALWVLTRTNGLPFGPDAGVPEQLGPAGTLTVLLELVVVVGAAWGMLPREQASRISLWKYRFALGGAAVLVAAVMAPGVVAGVEHTHGGTGHHGTGGQDETGHHGTDEQDGTGHHETGGQDETGHHETTPTPTPTANPEPPDSHDHSH
ncbi:hypothetical protein [Amycolatopsis palatopharyngis]|uniref:hypothetical protein n=1 Tax=Amycolatopsis palatopharyngis TaxID=187982 RepID=UPI000E21C7B2|nr:hypothetical protein [Amycolatopsis palatopharyngis]